MSNRADDECSVYTRPGYYDVSPGWDVIDWANWSGAPFAIANAVKYLIRAGNKDGETATKDLRKAIENIARYIEFLESADSAE